MFEKQKWSKTLKKAARKFQDEWTDVLDNEDALAELINMAIEEGFEDARETVNDWHDDSDREPQRDESRD